MVQLSAWTSTSRRLLFSSPRININIATPARSRVDTISTNKLFRSSNTTNATLYRRVPVLLLEQFPPLTRHAVGVPYTCRFVSTTTSGAHIKGVSHTSASIIKISTTSVAAICLGACLYYESSIRRPYLQECEDRKERFESLSLGGVDYYGQLDFFTTDRNIAEALQPGDVLEFTIRAEGLPSLFASITELIFGNHVLQKIKKKIFAAGVGVGGGASKAEMNSDSDCSSKRYIALCHGLRREIGAGEHVEIFVEGLPYNEWIAQPKIGEVVLRKLEEQHQRKGPKGSSASDVSSPSPIVEQLRAMGEDPHSTRVFTVEQLRRFLQATPRPGMSQQHSQTTPVATTSTNRVKTKEIICPVMGRGAPEQLRSESFAKTVLLRVSFDGVDEERNVASSVIVKDAILGPEVVVR